jgi:hypothetical protein
MTVGTIVVLLFNSFKVEVCGMKLCHKEGRDEPNPREEV